jgi:hypothetical protein
LAERRGDLAQRPHLDIAAFRERARNSRLRRIRPWSLWFDQHCGNTRRVRSRNVQRLRIANVERLVRAH